MYSQRFFTLLFIHFSVEATFWLDQFMDAAMTLTTFNLLLANENIILRDPTASEKQEADRIVLENTLPAKVTQLLTILNPLPTAGAGSLMFPGSSRKPAAMISTPPTTEPQPDNEQSTATTQTGEPAMPAQARESPKTKDPTAMTTQTGDPATPAQAREPPMTDTERCSPTVASADTVILHDDENPKVCVCVCGVLVNWSILPSI